MDCCSDNQTITIYKGFPTHFNNNPLINVSFDTPIDLTGFSAIFRIGETEKTYTDIADGFSIDLTKEETGALPVGLNYGELIVVDNETHKRPFTTALPFNVKTFVEGDIHLDNYNVNVTTKIKGVDLTINIETPSLNPEEIRKYIEEHNIDEESHPYILGELDKKVDKVSTANRVYGTDENGDQTTYDANSFGQVDDVQVGGVSVVQNKIARLGTMAGESANDYRTASDQDAIDDGLSGRITANTNKFNDYRTASEQDSIDNGLSDRIDDIEEVIPEQASAQNQLADKNFVNSSIATNTSNFIGTFNSLEELEDYSGTVTNNDYAFVIGLDSDGNTVYNRYKYSDSTTPASWIFEYALNNSSFTANQWAAINSGATNENIAQIETNTNAIQAINNSAVMNSGITSTKVIQYDGYATSKQDVIDDLSTIRSNAAAGKNASDTIDGYGNIVTHNTNEFATSEQGEKADTALQPLSITSGTYSLLDVNSSGLVTNGSNIMSNCLLKIDNNVRVSRISILPDGYGVKLYDGIIVIPNGKSGSINNFNKVIISSSKIKSEFDNNSKSEFLVCDGNNLYSAPVESSISGTTAPKNGLFYNTNTNIISLYKNGSQISTNLSVPLCIFSKENGIPKNIVKTFNGFSYLGGAIFSLGGVTGLIPNGRDSSGRLLTNQYTTTSQKVWAYSLNTNGTYNIILSYDNFGAVIDTNCYFDVDKNDVVNASGSSYASLICGQLIVENLKIKDFIIKPIFFPVSTYELAQKQDLILDLSTIRSGASAGATAVQPSALNSYVPTSRTINGKALSSNISLTATDVNALPNNTVIPTDISGNTINGAPLSNTSSHFFGTSTSAATDVEKVVSIPSITSLSAGQFIIVLPTITSSVANATLKLNNFEAYPIRYQNSAITTSTKAYTWTANTPSVFVFDGNYWRFVCQGYRQVYSAMSVAEGTTGTATTIRVMRADYLKQIIQKTTLTGIDTSTSRTVVATDTITEGIGKLQAQIGSIETALHTINSGS